MKLITYARLAGLMVLAAFAAGCTVTAPVFDTDAEVAAVSYTSDEPPSLTLYTSINENSGLGEHTALLINGSERVIYDPAGRFKHEDVREQGDVLFGITPEVLDAFNSHQAIREFTAFTQHVEVPLEVADQAILAARAQGRSSDGLCVYNTVAILRQVDGFEDIEYAILPNSLKWDFVAKTDGVTVKRYYE